MLKSLLRLFAKVHQGSIPITFGLAVPLILGFVAASINYSEVTQQRTKAQNVIDAAALAGVALFKDGTKTAPQIQAATQQFLAGHTSNLSDVDTQSTVTVDMQAQTVKIGYSAPIHTAMPFVIWDGVWRAVATTTATLGPPPRMPICIMITEPVIKHTLLGSAGAHINFDSCLVQVNTANWDAVEMKGISYLHSTSGQNCFVGDIHFGDVTPPKSPNCTFFADPFAGMAIPAAAPCAHTNLLVTTPSTLFPGIYCGGLAISATSTLNKGVYIINGGALSITGALTNVTGNGVTFILTGGATMSISTTGTINLSPSSAADGGAFAGFAIYSDQAAPASGKNAQRGGTFTISSATVNLSGIIYAAGQTFNIDKKANVTINPGSIVADFLLPTDANLTLTGTLSSSDAASVAMRKSIEGKGNPILAN